MIPTLWQHILQPSSTAAVANHLWQSTIFFLIASMLTLALRSNGARTRYWVWMLASLKFLLPFSLLITAGEALRGSLARPLPAPVFASSIEHITLLPYTVGAASSTVSPLLSSPVIPAPHVSFLPVMLLALWCGGTLLLASAWLRSWLRLRATVRAAVPMTLITEVPVLASPTLLEPGVFGILRPVLLLPAGIADRLPAAQLSAVLAHEMSHVRRRDNLTAALHMVVKALFWFHPAVWFVQARLLEERERACDEAVLQAGNAAELYAESILSVCRFYCASPLPCVAGITGSDLKRRIARIMAPQVTLRLNVTRKLLLGLTGTLALALPLLSGVRHVARADAQTAAQTPATTPTPATGLAGTWQGTLHAGKDLRTVVKITKGDDGGYKSVFYSIDQGGDGLPVTKTTLDGSTVKMSLTMISGSYEGKLSADGKSILGNWTQGPTPLPLNFARATPETEWTIPAPTPRLPPMDANASPTFEVATIKPSKPDEQGKAFLVQGRRFKTINTTMSEIMSFAFGVHAKQIVNAPAWFDTDKFDIDAQPDGEGAPSDKQWKGMLQKLLVDRCKITMHREKRDLSVYVLGVSRNGQKMTRSEGDPNGLPGLFFRGRLGDLGVRNANMADFAGLLQNAVLDRPVLDQTGITGRWDFTLLWTPDDSQFGGMAAKTPPPADGSSAPALYTAIQEQIGLKLDATKAPAEVIVLDHVDKPSDN